MKANFIVESENNLEESTLNQAYMNALDEVLEEDETVVSLDADLMHAVGVQNIAGKYKGRVLDVGIAEANMMGMAAGLAYSGKKPYAHTFACFATRRTFDQIFISSAYGKNDIKIFGSDPGICAAYNGGTHMPFEDIGLMRTIPNATIIDIADNTMMKAIVHEVKEREGVVYFRAGRQQARKVYKEGSNFQIGKGNVLVDGNDVTIITSGIMAAEALDAAKILNQRGISAAVIDMFTIKPIDQELIVKYAQKTGAVVTTDNHNENGGLGDAVASVLGEHCPTPMKKIAIHEQFGEVGSFDYLKERFGFNAQGIMEAVTQVLSLTRG